MGGADAGADLRRCGRGDQEIGRRPVCVASSNSQKTDSYHTMDYNYSPRHLQEIEDFSNKIAERGADDCWLCNRPFSHGEICLVTCAATKLVIIGKCCVLEAWGDPTVRLAERFAGLFAGRDDAYGEVVLEWGASKSASDYTVRRITHHQPLTVDHWRRHLDFYNSERV